MYSDPVAYFLTWSCYGTRLHGDDRGTVDRKHNIYDTPELAPNPALVVRREFALRHAPFVMGDAERAIVDSTIRAHCAYRAWILHAAHVRTNHVHVVVGAGKRGPKPVMEQFKAWCTRKLRDAGLLDKDAPAWTEHGSTKYVWDDKGLFEAVEYVRHRQGEDLD